ncbi:MAG TPA: DsbE family thiol:disulfide interchange protein [Steroidobacteraceae bacterium]|nr:DsbE family thiol:disulfide interchange protein [Steroidobacteraceae bacterium]
MNRFWIPLIAFALLCAMFGVALKRAPDKEVVVSALINKPAPEFRLPDLLNPGQTVDSTRFKGRWVLVNVWGSWCVECSRENPVLLDIQKSGKVAVLGINYNDKDEDARKFLADLGNPFAAVGVDREGRVAIDYGVYGAPENFLVNPQGVIVKKVWGITPDIWQNTLLPLIDGTKS